MQVTAVGNYPKIGSPGQAPNLRSAIHRFDRGEITSEELGAIGRQVTAEVLGQQAEAGLDLVTDGQIDWQDGQTFFASGLEGFSLTGLIRYFDTNTYYRQPEITGQIKWTKPISVDNFTFAKDNSPRPVKAVVTGPYTLAKLSKLPNKVSLGDLALELAVALNQEAKALESAGATIIQFDEPAITKNPADIKILEATSSALTSGIRAKTAIYTWFGDIKPVAGQIFALPFDVIGLDFAWGPKNWDVMGEFPGTKDLGLGIMDGRNTRLETGEELVAEIDRGLPYVDHDRMHVNTSCGLDYLPRDRAFQKMVRLVEAVNHVKSRS